MADDLVTQFQHLYRQAWRTFPDVVPTLERLTGLALPMAVITDGRSEIQLEKLASLGLRSLFSVVVTSDSAHAFKPEGRIFHAACSSLRLHPETVLHVGNDLVLDVIGAADAGLRSLHLDRRGRESGSLSDRIGSLHDLRVFVT